MAGPRCPDCCKFVSMETQDPEVESIEIDDGSVTISVRLVRVCADCGTEMRETTLEFEEYVETEHEHHKDEPDNKPKSCDECGGPFTISDTGVANHVTEDGSIDYDKDALHVAFATEDEEDYELEVEETGVEATERQEGKGRYAKTFYGASVSYEVRCSCGEVVADGEVSEDCQASYFDDLT